jgi:hypothetical protein
MAELLTRTSGLPSPYSNSEMRRAQNLCSKPVLGGLHARANYPLSSLAQPSSVSQVPHRLRVFDHSSSAIHPIIVFPLPCSLHHCEGMPTVRSLIEGCLSSISACLVPRLRTVTFSLSSPAASPSRLDSRRYPTRFPWRRSRLPGFTVDPPIPLANAMTSSSRSCSVESSVGQQGAHSTSLRRSGRASRCSLRAGSRSRSLSWSALACGEDQSVARPGRVQERICQLCDQGTYEKIHAWPAVYSRYCESHLALCRGRL